MPENIELLTAHHLPYRVVNIIENAQEFVLLVTAYLTSWTHLDHAIKTTIARGVPINLVMRAPDGAKRDREKREQEAEDLRQLGVKVHFVERLHAKAYVNEKEAIVTSFNLVSGSNESIELGGSPGGLHRLLGPAAVQPDEADVPFVLSILQEGRGSGRTREEVLPSLRQTRPGHARSPDLSGMLEVFA